LPVIKQLDNQLMAAAQLAEQLVLAAIQEETPQRIAKIRKEGEEDYEARLQAVIRAGKLRQ
jgi:hypothetical protein